MLLLYLSLIESVEDQSFFEKLYNTYRLDMYMVAHDVVHNQYDAEDAVHDVFLSVTCNLSVLEKLDQRQQKAYLCRAARNCAINIYSKQKRENEFLSSCDAEIYSSFDEDDVLDVICCEENAQKIKRCILSLPDAYRDILHLYFVEDLQAKQIAKTLGLSETSVRQRIVRGKRMLIEKFEMSEVSADGKQ